jgi:hypothetical protein
VVGAGGRLIDVGRILHVQRFVRAFGVEDVDKRVLQEVGGGGLGGQSAPAITKASSCWAITTTAIRWTVTDHASRFLLAFEALSSTAEILRIYGL